MPPPRSFVAAGMAAIARLSPFEDDDDDICPVCDGECTCRSRAGPSTRPLPPPLPSTSSIAPAASQKQRQTQPVAPYPLKIKLTVPPNLKFRKFAPAVSSGDSRRAAPTKASRKRKGKLPLFVRAGPVSSHTSSPESSDFDSADDFGSSDEDEDERFVPRTLHGRAKKQQPPTDDPSQKRRDHPSNNRWELKPRRASVGPDDADMDAESETMSAEEEQGADDEDDGNEDDDEADVELDADVVFAEPEDDPVVPDTAGKLGASLGGVATTWSDGEDDEESSFDADIFFANLDDSSDSCSSPSALRNDAFASDFETDVDPSFSADEEDALLLMNVDPTVQVRRTAGEFEVGVELDGLSFGWDGQLMLPPQLNDMNSIDLEMFNGETETDVDMTASDGGSVTEDQAGSDNALDETDGETTEDELVDSDGLPNSRAMKLFRWPLAVSAIDPASTLSPTLTSPPHVPAHTSQTTRIALAAMSAQRGSPAPTPADILSGKICMEDLDDIEINTVGFFEDSSPSSQASQRAPAVPRMGQFPSELTTAQRHAIIDGSGGAIPSPFPSRIHRARPRVDIGRASIDSRELSTDAESHVLSPSQDDSTSAVLVPGTPADDTGAQTQVPTSEDPSSTEAIDLDDVLDPSFMDSDPVLSEPETPVQESSNEHRDLHRWDRIPVATFRRIRESSLLEGAGTGSDSGFGSLYAGGMGSFVKNDMLGTPKIRHAASSSKTKTPGSSRRARSKGKGSGVANNLLMISPVLLPVRDGPGERNAETDYDAAYSPFDRANHTRYEQRTRKELRKEKAMMKRKLSGKGAIHSPQRHQTQHHHHRHLPNMKTRGTNSMQRTFSTASNAHVPRLNL